jgi:ribonuclease HI
MMTQNQLAFPEQLTGPRIEGVLHFDGSCNPNPGPNSRAGFILRVGCKIIERSEHLGPGTNNTAEYHALILGLREALSRGVTHLEVYGDSLLVIRGVKRGPRKSGKPHLEVLKREAISLIRKFASIDLNWVAREQNQEADAICG